MRYFDAHLHLQDERLSPHLETIVSSLVNNNGIEECIVNGTSPEDWEQVSKLGEHTRIRPAFGLHPWKVAEAPDDWFETLQSFLNSHSGALMGEIGLDKWIRNPHFPQQVIAFEKQLKLAAALDLPPTIHCLKAWGHLLSSLEKLHHLLPGFLLHSYNGPAEMVENFVEMGAYFSISGYFARPEKASKLEPWKRIPLDRILIETDAPDMLPPADLQLGKLEDHEGKLLNHPTNIRSIYQWAADWFEVEPEAFTQQIEKNYRRLFGSKSD